MRLTGDLRSRLGLGRLGRGTALLASAGLIGAMLLVSLVAAWHLPAGAQVPIHWGEAGLLPDRYAGKEGLLFFPLVAAAITAALAAVPMRRSGDAGPWWSERAYALAWVAAVLGVAALHALTVASVVA